MHFKRMVLLSILVPTRNRAGDLKRCLASSPMPSTQAHCSDKIEVVCVDNWSVDDTPEVIAAARARMPYLREERHHEERPSAEASYFHGAAFCRGEFVWSFGDDDEIDPALSPGSFLSSARKISISSTCASPPTVDYIIISFRAAPMSGTARLRTSSRI